MQIKQDTRLLPIAKVFGRDFLVDVEHRELRDFNNPDNVMNMHSPIGRQIINEMQGTHWNGMGVSTGNQKGLEV